MEAHRQSKEEGGVTGGEERRRRVELETRGGEKRVRTDGVRERRHGGEAAAALENGTGRLCGGEGRRRREAGSDGVRGGDVARVRERGREKWGRRRTAKANGDEQLDTGYKCDPTCQQNLGFGLAELLDRTNVQTAFPEAMDFELAVASVDWIVRCNSK